MSAEIRHRKVNSKDSSEADSRTSVSSMPFSRRSRPDRPVHLHIDSPISNSTGFTNYRGFLNLCVVLLVLSNFRVALENVMKYGLLVDPFYWVNVIISEPSSPNTVLFFMVNVFILFSLGVEKGIAVGKISAPLSSVLIATNLAVVLIFPAAVVLIVKPFLMFSMFSMGLYSITFLKLFSYHMVNGWCRDWAKSNPDGKIEDLKPGEVMYPDNLNVRDIYYFMLAPTLCYELNFPRNDKIRIRFLLRRIAEMILLSQVMLAMIQQWIFPAVINTLEPFHQMDIARVIERVCKLAIPNHIIWLIFFYWMFHSCLNFTGELLRFADRDFYRDWWNAESVGYFWQNWNICVHRWCVRHLYKPMLYQKYSKMQAALAVFLVSAFFHEYLVSVPLSMFRLWSFLAMMFQIPFAVFCNQYLRGMAGNISVWLSLIVGQPIAIMMYFHDYYVLNVASKEVNNSTVTM